MGQDNQYCTFMLDDLLFGVEVQQVQEVIRFQNLTNVPLSSNVVLGLINLRGQIVTALDLRRRLALPDRDEGELPMNVVIRTEGDLVSLLVDEIGDVVEVEDTRFENPPDTLNGVARDLITGTYKLEDRLLLVLDTAKAVTVGSATAMSSIRG